MSSNSQERFDLITFSNVVEHLPDPVATLVRASALLEADGKMWISVPNAVCRSSRLLQWKWHSADLPIHLHHFPPSSIQKLIASAGLRSISVSTYSLPAAVKYSRIAEFRSRWRLPGRISKYFLTNRLIARITERLDRNGEAIIAEVGCKT